MKKLDHINKNKNILSNSTKPKMLSRLVDQSQLGNFGRKIHAILLTPVLMNHKPPLGQSKKAGQSVPGILF